MEFKISVLKPVGQIERQRKMLEGNIDFLKPFVVT